MLLDVTYYKTIEETRLDVLLFKGRSLIYLLLIICWCLKIDKSGVDCELIYWLYRLCLQINWPGYYKNIKLPCQYKKKIWLIMLYVLIDFVILISVDLGWNKPLCIFIIWECVFRNFKFTYLNDLSLYLIYSVTILTIVFNVLDIITVIISLMAQ